MRSAPRAFDIRSTGRYGVGAYAARDIKQGTIIHVLSGITVSGAESVRRIKSDEEQIDDPLQVGVRTYLDLDEISRSINHSCNPNAGMRRRSELFALRDITRGEQITYDYSTTIAPTVWFMKCRCGAPSCRRIIGDIRSIPRARLLRYKQAGALQRYMIKIIGKPGWRRRLPPYEQRLLIALGPDKYRK